MKQEVVVELGGFAFKALSREARQSKGQVPAMVVQAIHRYLDDKDLGRPNWPYPAFLRDKDVGVRVRLELSIDRDLWHSLVEEADMQGVSARQMAEHAALYYVAEVDAGRVTPDSPYGPRNGES